MKSLATASRARERPQRRPRERDAVRQAPAAQAVLRGLNASVRCAFLVFDIDPLAV